MKTLVTGAGGFIGVNMCLYLLNKGNNVVAAYRSELPEQIKNVFKPYSGRIEFIKGDLLDESVYKSNVLTGIDSIIHCAVITSPNKSEIELFPLMARVNIQSTVNLLDYSLKNDIKSFVYVSSSGVYGSKCEIGKKVKENDELDLFSTYCVTKRSSEMLVKRYRELTKRNAVSGRIAAPYGPYERVTPSREAMSPVYKMIYYAINHKVIKIYGKDVVRDWTYVEDTVSQLYSLLKGENFKYDEYNVSCSLSTSIEDIAKAVLRVEPSFRYQFVNDPDDADIVMFTQNQRGALDITRIVEDTGCKPKYLLQEGIEKYINWAREQFIEL